MIGVVCAASTKQDYRIRYSCGPSTWGSWGNTKMCTGCASVNCEQKAGSTLRQRTAGHGTHEGDIDINIARHPPISDYHSCWPCRWKKQHLKLKVLWQKCHTNYVAQKRAIRDWGLCLRRSVHSTCLLACVSVCNYYTYVCTRSQTHMHNVKVRQVAKETAMISKDRSIQIKTLNEKLRRQEYLTKKQSRATESVIRKNKTAVNRMIKLEDEITAWKGKTRMDLLEEYVEDIASLKQTQRDLQKSTQTWSTRWVCVCNASCVRAHRVRMLCTVERRQKSPAKTLVCTRWQAYPRRSW